MSKDVWQGGADNWDTPGDWSAGLPTSTSFVIIDAGDPLVTASISVADIVNEAKLTFDDGGTCEVSGYFDNTGDLYLDTGGGGGTDLTIGGAFMNSGVLQIGSNFASNVTDDTLTVGSIDNAGGSIVLNGAASGSERAALVVEGGVNFGAGAGLVTGSLLLINNSLLEFAGDAQITRIARGGSLTLYGAGAFVADAGSLGSNSALQGLTTIAGGNASLALDNGAKVTTDGPLTVLADGSVLFDVFGSQGGSMLDVGGSLTNYGNLLLGNSGLGADDVLQVASLADAAGATLSLQGGSTSDAMAMVLVEGAAQLGIAAGALNGKVQLAGEALIAFAGGGQITTIAKAGELSLSGPDAFVADATGETSNSALQGLALVYGSLTLDDADISTDVAMTIAGQVEVDAAGLGGSTLAIGKGLTITAAGKLAVGNPSLGEAVSVAATSLTNAGTITLQGAGANLRVGALSNSGVITVGSQSSLTIGGASNGTGQIDIGGGGTVELTGAGSDDGIDFTGAGEVIVEGHHDILANPVTGFASGDSIGFNTAWVSTDQVVYTPNLSATGGTVEVETKLGAEVAAFQVVGNYTVNDFQIGHAGSGSSLIVNYQPV